MFKKLKHFYWCKNNFEGVQLGLIPQWKWYTCSLSFSPSYNFSLVTYHFGISMHLIDMYLIPTIRFNTPRHGWKEFLKDFTLYFHWLNINIMLIIGHWFYHPFKGYKSKEKIAEYKKFLKEVQDEVNNLETVE